MLPRESQMIKQIYPGKFTIIHGPGPDTLCFANSETWISSEYNSGLDSGKPKYYLLIHSKKKKKVHLNRAKISVVNHKTNTNQLKQNH